MRGVGAQLVKFAFSSPDQDTPVEDQLRPIADEGPDGGSWRAWAIAQGFEPTPPSEIPDSLGIRVLTTAPSHLEPEVMKRRLFWEDPVIGARVFVRD